VVGDDAEFPAFQQESEMPDSAVGSKQFTIKRGIPFLGGCEFLRKKCEGTPGAVFHLL
jgi:hypothetical protein